MLKELFHGGHWLSEIGKEDAKNGGRVSKSLGKGDVAVVLKVK